ETSQEQIDPLPRRRGRNGRRGTGGWQIRIPALTPCQGRPQMSAPPSEADGGQFIERQSGERRAQHRQQRPVLQRVVEQLQQAQEVRDFQTRKKPAASGRERDVLGLEYFGVTLR